AEYRSTHPTNGIGWLLEKLPLVDVTLIVHQWLTRSVARADCRGGRAARDLAIGRREFLERSRQPLRTAERGYWLAAGDESHERIHAFVGRSAAEQTNETSPFGVLALKASVGKLPVDGRESNP
ncbi:hypothetical protein, partial [Anatilimnocola floriformis]|uniref:hypothetical protein n=1 Tax=Anatilimnocola floriformis TaxID=2948575 RepID=UPI0020C51207